MKEINLNHDMYINIDSLSCGTTDLKVKISRNYYFVRVEKIKSILILISKYKMAISKNA